MRTLPLLSIIVPVYNVEEFLYESLLSMSAQDTERIEFILVNDGSTDSSEQIIKKIINDDKRFKLFNIKNSGVSAARNYGIDKANGSYIGFMDPDDLIHPEMYSILIETAIKTKSQIVSCGYTKMEGERNKNVYPLNSEKSRSMLEIDTNKEKFRLISNLIGISNQDVYKALNNESTDFFEGMVWRNIYDINLINSNNIKFDESLNYKEDELFNLECFLLASKVVILNECLYTYRIRTESLTTKYKEDLFDLELYIVKLKKKLLSNFFEETEIINLNTFIDNKFLSDFIGIINNIQNRKKNGERDKYKIYAYRELKKYCANSIVNKSNIKIFISIKYFNIFIKTFYLYLAKKNKPLFLLIVSYLVSFKLKKRVHSI